MRVAEFYNGKWGRITIAQLHNGEKPAAQFIEALPASDLAKLLSLLKRAGDMGVLNLNNREKFKKLEDNLYEFKIFQIRIPCFLAGRTVILTHGFFKKQDKVPKAEIARAKRIREECQ